MHGCRSGGRPRLSLSREPGAGRRAASARSWPSPSEKRGRGGRPGLKTLPTRGSHGGGPVWAAGAPCALCLGRPPAHFARRAPPPGPRLQPRRPAGPRVGGAAEAPCPRTGGGELVGGFGRSPVCPVGGGGGRESGRRGAGSQWIVAARPLCHLQCPVAYLSRLQRILPAARWELRSTAGSRGRCAAGASPATRALGGRLAPTAGRGAGRRARAPLH